MSIKEKKMVKNVVMIVVFILLLLLCWLFLAGKSYSKYKEEVRANCTNEIAKAIFVVDGAKNIQINGIEDTVYDFHVKNYDETGVNEVGLDYFIEMVNLSEADLEFELTKNGELVNLSENKTDFFHLASAENQVDDYQLKIKYHDNPAQIADIKGNVQIKAQAVQTK